ncbi:MAG TPA: hypothetical protein VMS08_05665 [Candidatus Saccharimonadia bacterium]|nr:hypothetical protein [Candidatus Saccharimonadia bacterium]
MPIKLAPIAQNYPGIWKLARGPEPRLLFQLMRWIMDDDERLAQAAGSLEWIEVGFHVLRLATQVNSRGVVTATLQANLYSGEFPGNRGVHGHGRDARATWYALPHSRQVVSRYQVLPATARRLRGVSVQEFAAGVNCLEDPGDGGQPGYNVVPLDRMWLLARLTSTQVGALTTEDFRSFGVHHVGFEGEFGVSIHGKSRREPSALSTRHGLMWCKGLTADEAAHVVERAPVWAGGAKTMVFAPTRDDVVEIRSGRSQVLDVARGVSLLGQALRVSERCAA